jgi:hypothetical protein
MYGIDYSNVLCRIKCSVETEEDMVIGGDVETDSDYGIRLRLLPGTLDCQAHLLPHTFPRDVTSEFKHVPLHGLSIDRDLLSPYIIHR